MFFYRFIVVLNRGAFFLQNQICQTRAFLQSNGQQSHIKPTMDNKAI